MAEDLYEHYAGLFDQQVDLVEEALVGVIRSALGNFSCEFKRHLRSLVPPRRPSFTSNSFSRQQEVNRAQEEIEAARDSTQRQIATALANGFGALAQLPPALDVSENQPTVPPTQATVGVITANNNNADSSDDDSMSIKSEDSSECESDYESHSDEAEIKEEPIEEDANEIDAAAATPNVNSNNNNVSVKTEIESECDSSDSESSDEEEELTTDRGIKEEIDDAHSDDQEMGDSVDENEEMQTIEEQQEENQTGSIENTNQNDYNFEIGHSQFVNSIEINSEQQSDAMIIGDDEISNEQDQNDEPTIIVVNYEEFDVRSIESSVTRESAFGGSSNEELPNIAEPDGDFVETFESNQGRSEQQSDAMMIDDEENINEASNEQDQNRQNIGAGSFTASTLTRRSTRVSAAKAVNYAEASENSVAEQQQSTLTGTRKRKRSIRLSRKSPTSKRTRNVPAPIVAAELEQQENAESDDEENDGSESKDISLSIIVHRLKCHVPDCKKRFPNKVQLDGHHLAKHAIEKYDCKVKDCNESYATKAELKVHRDTVHGHLGNNWPCGQCETTCTTYKNLREHVYIYHEEGQFACSADKCNYTEATRKKVQNHQAKHRPAKYHCTFAGCDASFYLPSKLTVHFRSHSKEKPFLCSQCPNAFSTKSLLTRHELIHSGLKPFSCTWPQCDYSANRKSTVITHVRMVHFHLPQSKKEQTEKNIIENRDPRVFVAKTAITGN